MKTISCATCKHNKTKSNGGPCRDCGRGERRIFSGLWTGFHSPSIQVSDENPFLPFKEEYVYGTYFFAYKNWESLHFYEFKKNAEYIEYIEKELFDI
jgi:hypothetical protein